MIENRESAHNSNSSHDIDIWELTNSHIGFSHTRGYQIYKGIKFLFVNMIYDDLYQNHHPPPTTHFPTHASTSFSFSIGLAWSVSVYFDEFYHWLWSLVRFCSIKYTCCNPQPLNPLNPPTHPPIPFTTHSPPHLFHHSCPKVVFIIDMLRLISE